MDMGEDRQTRNIIWIFLCAAAILVAVALYLYFFSDEPLAVVGALLMLLLGALLSYSVHLGGRGADTVEWEAQYREELLDAFSADVDDVFLLLEGDGCTVSYVSANVERLFGVTREDVLRDVHCLTKTAAGRSELISAKELSRLESGQRISREQEYIHWKTRERRWCWESFYRVSVRGIKQYVAVIADHATEIPMDEEPRNEAVLKRPEIPAILEADYGVNENDAGVSASEIMLDDMMFLVVEDIGLNAVLLSEMLSSEGAKSEIAENGQRAYEMFRNSSPGYYDVILMDVQMPVMNGYEATRAIRRCEHPDAKRIKIIAMTAMAFPEDVQNALDAGMNAHMAKPIDMEIVKRTIHRLKTHD